MRASAGELTDLQINITAAEAQNLWAGQSTLSKDLVSKGDALDIFEAAYNVACEQIARGHYERALELLKKSKGTNRLPPTVVVYEIVLTSTIELCEASDELSPEDKKVELLPIKIQEIHVYLQQGKIEEGEALIRGIDFSEYVHPTPRLGLLSDQYS